MLNLVAVRVRSVCLILVKSPNHGKASFSGSEHPFYTLAQCCIHQNCDSTCGDVVWWTCEGANVYFSRLCMRIIVHFQVAQKCFQLKRRKAIFPLSTADSVGNSFFSSQVCKLRNPTDKPNTMLTPQQRKIRSNRRMSEPIKASIFPYQGSFCWKKKRTEQSP